MADDLIDDLRIFDKRDDSHLASTRRAQQRIELVNLFYHLRQALRQDKRLLLFDNQVRIGFLLIPSKLSHVLIIIKQGQFAFFFCFIDISYFCCLYKKKDWLISAFNKQSGLCPLKF